MIRPLSHSPRHSWAWLLLPLVAVVATSCSPIRTENTVDLRGDPDRPIHIVVDVNIRIDRQLDDFFSFENALKAPASRPENP
jgi:hypothetical protein